MPEQDPPPTASTASTLLPGRPIGRGTLKMLLLGERSRSNRRMLLMAAMFLVVVGILAWLLWRQTGAQEDSLAELARLQDQLHRAGLAAAESEELRQKLAAVESRLAAAVTAPDWAGVTKRNERAVFLCLGLDAKRKEVALGTAFVLDAEKRILVSNAHVAGEISRMPVRRLVQAGTGEHFGIEEISIHPRWQGGKGPDLALLRVRAEAAGQLTALPLLAAERLRDLRPGVQIGTLGFPGELASRYLAAGDGERLPGVVPTFKTGWIGRITGADGTSATPELSRLVQHSASLSKGTSGSPLFDGDGNVVAISFGGIGSKDATDMSTAQIGFAVRADEIAAMRAEVGW